MLNLKPFQPPALNLAFKPPREWLPHLRTLLDAHPVDDLASTEALCCRIVGDFTAGIVLHRLLFWLPRGIRSDNTIWKSDREWYAELNLSYAEMRRVRVRLAPVVKSWVAKAQGAPTHHYQVRVDALIRGIATVLNCSSVDVKSSLLEKVENGFSPSSLKPEKSITIPHQNQDERLLIYQSYLNRFVGFTPDITARLADQCTRLGESTVREVLERCKASKGQSWKYVLKALESVSTPSHAPITELYDTPPRNEGEGAGAEGFDQMQQACLSSAECRDLDARIEAAKHPEPAVPTTIQDKWSENWNKTYQQLQVQLDRNTFYAWLRDAHFLRYEAGVYHIGVPNIYIRDNLQHRAYRDILRMVTDIAGESAELCFEVHKPAEQESDEVPMFKLLAQKMKAEQEFYRKFEAKK